MHISKSREGAQACQLFQFHQPTQSSLQIGSKEMPTFLEVLCSHLSAAHLQEAKDQGFLFLQKGSEVDSSKIRALCIKFQAVVLNLIVHHQGFSKGQLWAPLKQLNSLHNDRLFPPDEYRVPAACLKAMEIHVKNTDYSSLDYTRLCPDMVKLCKTWRQVTKGDAAGAVLALGNQGSSSRMSQSSSPAPSPRKRVRGKSSPLQLGGETPVPAAGVAASSHLAVVSWAMQPEVAVASSSSSSCKQIADRLPGFLQSSMLRPIRPKPAATAVAAPASPVSTAYYPEGSIWGEEEDRGKAEESEEDSFAAALEQAAVSLQPKPAAKFKQYFDEAMARPARLYESGSLEYANMEAGENGFMVGVFADGMRVDTEEPVPIPVVPKPKGKPKGKPKAKGNAAAVLAEETDGESAAPEAPAAPAPAPAAPAVPAPPPAEPPAAPPQPAGNQVVPQAKAAPKAAPKAKAKAKAKAKSKAEKAKAKEAKDSAEDTLDWALCASNPEKYTDQGYIRVHLGGAKKKTLLISVSRASSADYCEILDKLFEEAKTLSANLTTFAMARARMIVLRSELRQG